jgi:hypothetical protein
MESSTQTSTYYNNYVTYAATSFGLQAKKSINCSDQGAAYYN